MSLGTTTPAQLLRPLDNYQYPSPSLTSHPILSIRSSDLSFLLVPTWTVPPCLLVFRCIIGSRYAAPPAPFLSLPPPSPRHALGSPFLFPFPFPVLPSSLPSSSQSFRQEEFHFTRKSISFLGTRLRKQTESIFVWFFTHVSSPFTLNILLFSIFIYSACILGVALRTDMCSFPFCCYYFLSHALQGRANQVPRPGWMKQRPKRAPDSVMITLEYTHNVYQYGHHIAR